MAKPISDVRRPAMLSRWARVAAATALALAGLNWLGWISGVAALTRGFSSWPRMTTWGALLMAVLAVAILVQTGRPSRGRVWVGCGLALLAGILGLVFLAEYAMGESSGLTRVLLSEAVSDLPASFPGQRPSAQTAWSVVFLSIAILLTRLDRRWSPTPWSACLAVAVAVPMVTGLAYLFDADALLSQPIPAVAGLLLLVAATSLARPDRYPLVWLLDHPERQPMARVVPVIALLPVVVGVLREALIQLGASAGTERVLSLAVGTAFVGIVVISFGRREQKLLTTGQRLERERKEAEYLYRLLAENSVDIVAYARGTEVVWISPSVEAALGWPPQDWIGTDFTRRIHADDLDIVATSIQEIAGGQAVTARARAATADGRYRWMEARGKPSFDTEGNPDGMIFSLRTIDEQVESERQLKRLARLDALTGLLNHRESMTRLEAALSDRRSAGPRVGLLFCDVDHFKTINDTWGHPAGDAVLSHLATRMHECIRKGDTVGRTGGDEMLVLLPGLNNLEEAREIAEKIRCRAAEPINQDGTTLHVTLSIGATIADLGESPAAVMARADAAMYLAKQAGRDNIICTEAG